MVLKMQWVGWVGCDGIECWMRGSSGFCGFRSGSLGGWSRMRAVSSWLSFSCVQIIATAGTVPSFLSCMQTVVSLGLDIQTSLVSGVGGSLFSCIVR